VGIRQRRDGDGRSGSLARVRTPYPERPASWYAKQKRQKPIRNALKEARVRHTQRRVFRTFTPLIQAIGDEEECRAETEYLWDAAGEIAVLIVAGSSGQ
jgi:hypothetical protein